MVRLPPPYHQILFTCLLTDFLVSPRRPKNKAIGDCTVEQLRVKLAGQQKLLANRKMMAALPDGGAKIAARCDELEEAIAAAEALEAAIKAEEPGAGAAVEHPDVLSTSSLTVTERIVHRRSAHSALHPDARLYGSGPFREARIRSAYPTGWPRL